MMTNRHASEMTSRISPSDLRFNRVIGIVILLLGAALAYSLVFTPFDQRVQFQWELNEEGRRVPITHVTCPSPWSIVFDDARLQGVVAGDLCRLPSRGHIVQGTLAALAAIPLGIWVFTRNPKTKPLPPLPASVRVLPWKR